MEPSEQQTTKLPTLAEMHAFLKARYKHDRFEGRDNPTWGEDYSWAVAQSSLDDLIQHKVGYIGQYESNTDEVIKYNIALEEIPSASQKRAHEHE